MGNRSRQRMRQAPEDRQGRSGRDTYGRGDGFQDGGGARPGGQPQPLAAAGGADRAADRPAGRGPRGARRPRRRDFRRAAGRAGAAGRRRLPDRGDDAGGARAPRRPPPGPRGAAARGLLPAGGRGRGRPRARRGAGRPGLRVEPVPLALDGAHLLRPRRHPLRRLPGRGRRRRAALPPLPCGRDPAGGAAPPFADHRHRPARALPPGDRGLAREEPHRLRQARHARARHRRRAPAHPAAGPLQGGGLRRRPGRRALRRERELAGPRDRPRRRRQGGLRLPGPRAHDPRHPGREKPAAPAPAPRPRPRPPDGPPAAAGGRQSARRWRRAPGGLRTRSRSCGRSPRTPGGWWRRPGRPRSAGSAGSRASRGPPG